MMMMMALLLALQTHIRDDHLRVVAHAVVVAAASIKNKTLWINSVSSPPPRSLRPHSPVQILTGALHIVAQIVT